MYQDYKEKVEFYLVYIREAHPSDEGKMPGNPDVKQPKTDEERREVASDCVKNLKLTLPALIDGMDNRVNKGYAAWPDRIYVVGADGKIAYKGKPGPFGFKPGDAEDAIKKLVGE